MQNKNPELPAPRDFYLLSGAPQAVDTFPANPEPDAVYYLPPIPPTGSESWNQADVDTKLGWMNRRLETMRGVHQLTRQHLTRLQTEKESLSAQAMTDSLTGLGNRLAFTEALQQAVRDTANDRDPRLDLLYMDLDKFKAVNDTRGHQVGDELLRNVADRFQAVVTLRAHDRIFRLGGDEFVAIVRTKKEDNDRRQDLTEDEAIAGISHRLEAAVATIAEEMNVGVGVSIGAVKHLPHESADDFLRRADEAMYARKRAKQGER